MTAIKSIDYCCSIHNLEWFDWAWTKYRNVAKENKACREIIGKLMRVVGLQISVLTTGVMYKRSCYTENCQMVITTVDIYMAKHSSPGHLLLRNHTKGQLGWKKEKAEKDTLQYRTLGWQWLAKDWWTIFSGNAMPQPKGSFSKYLLNCRKHKPWSLYMSPTDINEIKHIFICLFNLITVLVMTSLASASWTCLASK